MSDAEPLAATNANASAQGATSTSDAPLVPAWLADAPRGGSLAGLVRIELPEDALPWHGAIDEQVLRRRAQYTAGVELIAGNFGALEPLAWQGDALVLVFGGMPASELPGRAFTVAKELWDRVRAELDLPVRLAAHVGRVHPGAEPGTVTGDDVEACARLAAAAPIGTIALSEELTLALNETTRQEIAMLGGRPGDARGVYAFPRSALGTGAPVVVDETQHLWGQFRRYAAGPDVRLVRYVGFRLHKKEPPRLDIRDVFIPSEVEMRRRSDAEQRKADVLEGKLLPLPWSAQGATLTGDGSRPFRELYAKHRSIVLLGDPGSGKTTVLRWLAVLAASGSFALDTALGVAERLLPLPVSVGRLAEIRRGLGGETVSVTDALAGYFRGRSVHDDVTTLRAFLARELACGGCLVLLDGLDEVRGEERQAIYQWLESFAAEYPQNRFVVSSRVVGYTGFQLPSEVAEAVLRPFTEEQVERYVRAFHHAYVRWETGAEPTDQSEADRLLDSLRASPRLSALARNPFMLSALALIHRAEGKLPRHRVQAYEVFARALCETWAEARRLVAGETRQPIIEYEEEALPILGELALAMHEQYPTGVAPEAFVIGKLAAALEHQKSIAGVAAQRAAREFLKRAGQEVQLLLERGAGEWGFLHLTFQEFFVAAGLHATERFQEVALLHLFDSRWEEVIRLGVGYLALVQKRPTAAERFVKKVLEHEEPEPRKWMTRLLQKQVPLAALLAAEAGDALPAALQDRIAKGLAEWAAEMPREVSGPTLKDLALTDFVARVVCVCRMQSVDARHEVRAKAIWVLGELRSAEAVDDIVAALSDENEDVRLSAENAFKAVPVATPMMKLAEKFVDPRREVRISAINAIASSKFNLHPAALRTFFNDPDEGVRAAAVRACRSEEQENIIASALVQFASSPAVARLDREPEEVLAAMDIAMKDESPEVRDAVAGVLGRLGDEARLMSLMSDADKSVRQRAALGLFCQGLLTADMARGLDNEFLASLSHMRALRDAPFEARVEALRSSNRQVRMAGKLTILMSNPSPAPFFSLVGDASPDVRSAALRVLGLSDHGIPACLNALKDPEPEVRITAAQTLALRKRREALEPLLDAFCEGASHRAMIALFLSELGEEEAVGPLLTYAENSNADDRHSVWPAIGRLASSRHIERIERLLQNHQQPCATTDMIFSALWTIADRESRRAPDPSG